MVSMSTSISGPILATKLFIPPPPPKVVSRPRLIERLNEVLHRKLLLISAPAGFGKTTLVSEWLAGRQGNSLGQEPTGCAWLSLEEADSNPIRFLTYLISAMQTVVTTFGEGVMAALQSPQPPPIESVLTILLNEVAAIPDKFILVLDDYHVIDAKAVDDAIAFLLEHLPPQMHLVITTREDPQLPLARLRVRGQMTEVRTTDLRFTSSEAAEFLSQVMALKITAQEVVALETRTEGWIAGLQLAALSMKGRDDVAGFVRAFTGNNRYIVEYLAEEVLHSQSAQVQSFLLQTSILDRLCGALCDAVTGKTGSMSLLDALERGNLFVVPLDDKRHWFRYHHLFADMLAAHALQEQPTQVPIWHQRASAWYAANGLPADAIRHALAAKDFVRAADLVELAWPAMDRSFQAATWLGWARAIPDELVRARPVLSVAYAWAFLNGGDLEAAETRLSDAERWLYPSASQSERREAPSTQMVVVDEEQFRNLPASIATARSYFCQARGDIPGTVKYGRQALELLPEADHLRRGPAAALLGLAYWANGDLEAAYRAIADAMANFQKSGHLHFGISGIFGLGDIRTTQGRLRDAIKTYTQALHLALAHGEPLLRGTADLYMGLGELYREQGDADAALQMLRRSEEIGEQAGLYDWHYRFYRIQARFKQSEGDLAGALDLLDEAERRYRRTAVPDVRPLAALKTRVWVAQGKMNEAQRWVQEQRLSMEDELSYLREFEHITLVRVLLADSTNDPAGSVIHEALRLLDRLQQAAAAGGRMGSLIEIELLRALAHQVAGDMPGALVALERTLRLAEPEGYVRIFVDEGSPMARLLSAAAKQRMRPDYTRKLLAAFAPSEANALPAAILPPISAQPLIEPLSTRELEVLHLIGKGLSNGEISERLFLALSTVKGHNRNIFDKLQVQSRTEAIARARELGLM